MSNNTKTFGRKDDVLGWRGRSDGRVRYGVITGRLDVGQTRPMVRHVVTEVSCMLGDDHWFALPREARMNVGAR